MSRAAGPNDNSFVLRLTWGHRSALLVGDAEHEEERELMALARSLHADFLKVGHHGSRTSTSPAFLAAVRPSYAAISSGVRQPLRPPEPDHPHDPRGRGGGGRQDGPRRRDRCGRRTARRCG